RHGGREIPRHLVVGEIERGEPAMVVVRFALAPDLLRVMLVPGLRLLERQSPPVLDNSTVRDGEAAGVVIRGGPRQPHGQGVAVTGEGEAAAGAGDAPDVEQ